MLKSNKKLRFEEEEDLYQYASGKDLKVIYKKEKKQKRKPNSRVHRNE